MTQPWLGLHGLLRIESQPLVQAGMWPVNGVSWMFDGWAMGLGGWIWMGIWILALLAMVWLIVAGTRQQGISEDALDILRARFARGEISQEEFERARDALLVPR